MGLNLAAMMQGPRPNPIFQQWDFPSCWLGYQHHGQALLHRRQGPKQIWVWGSLFAREGETQRPEEILLQNTAGSTLAQQLQRVHGTYIGIFRDEQQQLLHLFTGPRGLKPLYLLQHKGQWIWSSELKGFLGVPGFKPNLQKEAISYFFELGFLPGELSWFEGIERLPAGCLLTIDLKTGKGNRSSYWSWKGLERIPDLDYHSSLQEGKRRWEKALARRIPSSQSISVSLSGGMDSRLILGGLEHQLDLQTFTFGKKKSWDVVFAQQVQQAIGQNHQWWELNAEN